MSDSRLILRASTPKPIVHKGLSSLKMVSAANDTRQDQGGDKPVDKSVQYYAQPPRKKTYAKDIAFGFGFLISSLWIAFCAS